MNSLDPQIGFGLGLGRSCCWWRPWLALAAAVLAGGCAGLGANQPGDRQFYKNQQVRHCLQLDKDKRMSESQDCWSQLLQRIHSDPSFVENEKLTPADLDKIRRKASRSNQRSIETRRELDACYRLLPAKHEALEQCFKDYLARHEPELSLTEKFEIKNSIASMKEAHEKEQGNIEATIEHAGKLLGANIHQEEEGIRIDAVSAGPLQQAQVQAQGLVLITDGVLTTQLDPTEQITRLEACEERPVPLLIRYGGKEQATFEQVEVQCGPKGAGRRLWQLMIPLETCSVALGPEVRLGIGWCYLGSEGVLEIREVCIDSAAAKAGVQPGQLIVTINGSLLMGKSYQQVLQLLEAYPNRPLSLLERSGTLASPSTITALPYNPQDAQTCWDAIRSRLYPNETVAKP